VKPGLPASAMKRLLTATLLGVLACTPSLALAGLTPSSRCAAGELLGKNVAQPRQLDVSPGSPQDYARREAASPQLAGFSGGGGGIYIGTGALVVALLVVVVILLVR
jgi:hypothetical protein